LVDQGDDARVSVSVGGELVLSFDLAALFEVDDPEVRAALTAEQREQLLALSASHPRMADEAESLSDHLALQVCRRFSQQ
jgi:hypothetical protein